MRQLRVRKIFEQAMTRLKRWAPGHRRSMETEHGRILKEELFPEHRPGGKLLEVLQAGPFAEPDFDPERARDRGRRVEL